MIIVNVSFYNFEFLFVAWSELLSWVQISDVGRSLYIGSFCPAMTSLSRCLEEAAFKIILTGIFPSVQKHDMFLHLWEDFS